MRTEATIAKDDAPSTLEEAPLVMSNCYLRGALIDLAAFLGHVGARSGKQVKETIMSQNIIFALEDVGAINQGALERQRAIRSGNEALQAAIEARRETLFVQLAQDARSGWAGSEIEAFKPARDEWAAEAA